MQVAPTRRGRRPLPRPEVTAAPLDDELILCDTRDGQVYALNPVGARVWGLLDGSRGIGTVARIIADDYSIAYARARADVDQLITSLRGADLLAN